MGFRNSERGIDPQSERNYPDNGSCSGNTGCRLKTEKEESKAGIALALRAGITRY